MNLRTCDLTWRDKLARACIWATVEIYCLRQVRHQVSESPIVLQAFLFLHIFDNFLPLFKHSFEARPLGSSSLAIFVCARWSALVLLPVPVWSSFPLLGRSLQPASLLERKWVLACFGHSQLLTSKFNYPAGAQNFSPSLQHTTIYYQLPPPIPPVLWPVGHPGRFWKDFSIVLDVVWVSFWVSFCAGSIFASHMRARLNE